VLIKNGWRLFFYSNEGHEPLHIHAQKNEIECKYWILADELEILYEFSYNFSPGAKREIEEIIFQHYDLIIEKWNNHFKK